MKLSKNSTYVSIKENKAFRNKFREELQNFYSESYKTLLKEIREDLSKWKVSHFRGLEDLILLWWQYSLNWYRFKAIPIKISAVCFSVSQLILKFGWKCKGSRITRTTLKKHKVGGLTIPEFKTYYKAMVITTVWYWLEDRHVDQWNRLKESK